MVFFLGLVFTLITDGNQQSEGTEQFVTPGWLPLFSTGFVSRYCGLTKSVRTTLKPWLKPLFVGMYVGESNHSVEFLNCAKWMSSIHSRSVFTAFHGCWQVFCVLAVLFVCIRVLQKATSIVPIPRVVSCKVDSPRECQQTMVPMVSKWCKQKMGFASIHSMCLACALVFFAAYHYLGGNNSSFP